jgi:hypothetical protein
VNTVLLTPSPFVALRVDSARGSPDERSGALTLAVHVTDPGRRAIHCSSCTYLRIISLYEVETIESRFVEHRETITHQHSHGHATSAGPNVNDAAASNQRKLLVSPK